MKILSARDEYDHLAPDYDRRWSDYTEATLRTTIDGLTLIDDGKVLDLAAGTGELARRLIARWPALEVVGVDLSSGMLAQASGKLVDQPWSPVQADAARLPFASGSFDAVLCTNAFHIFQKPEAVLTEVRRVLQPGAVLTLTDWCDDYLTYKLCSFWLRLTDAAFRRAYTLARCRQMLVRAGFTVADARKFKINWLWGLMRLEAR